MKITHIIAAFSLLVTLQIIIPSPVLAAGNCASCASTRASDIQTCEAEWAANGGTIMVPSPVVDGVLESCKTAAVEKESTCNKTCGGGAGGAAAGTVTLLNPLGLSDPRLIVGRIIKGILSIVGTITLAMFMYGGILWITSMGESKKVEKGKSIFVWTTLGLGIIAIAYTAVNAIMNALRTGSVT